MEMTKVETRRSVYNGTYINNCLFENYLFMKGTNVLISDAFINAKDIRCAINKLARRLGLHTYSKEDIEELNDDIKCGYYIVEEANYYDEKTNETYKYYVSTVYTK